MEPLLRERAHVPDARGWGYVRSHPRPLLLRCQAQRPSLSTTVNSLVGGGEPLTALPASVDVQAGNKLLFDAVMAGKLTDAEQLILSGTSASCVDDQMRTPLHYAAYNGDRDMAALLCDYTADIETRDSAVRTLAPLHSSSYKSSR